METEEIQILETKQRKEKKELQAQITALKKAAKNDKTRKKELAIEIAKLESDLEMKHKKELDELKAQSVLPEENNITSEPIITEHTQGKISKAQKRRDKKSQQDKERAEQIKLQEKENILGPRHVETQAIIAKLKENNLQIFSIPSDGDCLYKAVSHQVQISRNETTSIEELRHKVAEYIRTNKDDFIPFMSNPDTFDMLTDSEFDEYCEKIKNTKVWGGQLEIRALSNCLKVPIKVIQATGPDSIDQGMEYNGVPLILTYHRHMYSLGEHYNSTQPLALTTEDEEE